MTDINSVFIVGRLTRDMELKYTTTGTAIGNFSVANSQSRKIGNSWEEQAHFFDCVIIGTRATALQQYMTKGQQVAIPGALQQDRWEKDGQKHSRVKILVNDIQLVGGKRDNGQLNNTSSSYTDDFEDDQIPF